MAVSRREANKIKCRQQILKSARRLFKEKGYDSTMIEDIADKAGISKATLYNYFPNKESLLVGTMDDQIEATRKYIEQAGETEPKESMDTGEQSRADKVKDNETDSVASERAANNRASGYSKIRMALEFLVLDSRQFIDVSRRIMFLNACEASSMYGKVNEIKEMFRMLTDEAKKEGIFREDIHSVEIVELLMSIYLNSQFQWSDIEKLTDEQCRKRIERMMELTLNRVLSK